MKHFLIAIITVVMLAGCGGADERKAAYLEKAKQSIEIGDLDKARIELKNVLQIDPKDAPAHFQLGKVFEQKKNYRKAFGNYRKATELDPENLEYHAIIGRFYLLLAGDIERAIEKRDLILNKDANDIGGLLLKAGILYKQKDKAGAKKIAKDIFSKHPEHIENTLFLSSLLLREKEYDASLNVLNGCIKEQPENLILKNMLANAYVVAGKHELAEKVYKEILENKPELFSNHMKLAIFYQKIGATKKAENVLRKAIQEDEDDSERKVLLVKFLKQYKGNQEAINELNSLIEKNPKMGELRLTLGKLYLAENKHDEAKKVFDTAVSDFSEDSVGIKSRVYLAKLFIQKENIDAAVSIIDEAVKISPNDIEVNFVKAKLQLVSKDYEGAIISLRTVVKDAPENMEAYFLLSAAHIKNGEKQQASEIINRAYENNRTNKEGLMVLAKYHADNKNLVELEKIINNYLVIDPDNYEALSYKSSLLNEKKMYSDAKISAVRLIELYADKPNGYIQSVPYLLADKKIQEAIIMLEEGYKKVEENNRILDILVSLHVSMKDFNTAISKVRSAIDNNGEMAELHLLMAKIKLSSNKKADAKSALLKASSIKPGWNEPYFLLANIFMSDAQSQKAIKVLIKGIEATKNDLKLSLSLAQLYERIGDFNSAINAYEKAYKNNTDNILIVNNLASLLVERRDDESDLKRAKELADKLKNIDKSAILDTVGWVYYKTGDYAEAVNILKKVIEKSPDVGVFNYHLGMALYKAGDKVAAKKYLTVAVADKKSFSGKDDAAAHLKKLQ